MKKIIFIFILTMRFAYANAQGIDRISRPDESDLFHSRNLPAGVLASAYYGVWVPQGNLAITGNHAYIGFKLGTSGMIPHVGIAFSSMARLGRMPDLIDVKAGDSIYRSRGYTAAGFGIDAFYNLLRHRAHALNIEGGAGLDIQRILSVKRDDIHPKVKRTLVSPDINFGVGYQCWLFNTYLGIDVKYHFLFYNNEGGTSMGGNALTIGLVLGHVLKFD